MRTVSKTPHKAHSNNRITPRRRVIAAHRAAKSFDRLVKIMATLRAPGGCPWDRKQTHRSILPYLIEEAHEVKDAVLSGKPNRLREELGDLLLQIVFHAQMETEKGRFDIGDVADAISDKLVRRHPHVFGDKRTKLTAEQVLNNWERIKLSERKKKRASVLDGLSPSMPALLRAYRVQEKVAQFGFDWHRAEEVEEKLHEEVIEFHVALEAKNRRAVEDELGDLLFTLVNLARHLKVDPETALNATNAKFARRFEAMERSLRNSGIDPKHADLPTMEKHWQMVKR